MSATFESRRQGIVTRLQEFQNHLLDYLKSVREDEPPWEEFDCIAGELDAMPAHSANTDVPSQEKLPAISSAAGNPHHEDEEAGIIVLPSGDSTVAESKVGEKKTPARMAACYDQMRERFWIKNPKGVWILLTDAGFKRHLKSVGFETRVSPRKLMSPAEEVMHEIQMNHSVGYAGPLAGLFAGVHKVEGGLILVTSSPELIEPVRGDWPTLKKLVDGMLIDSIRDQRDFLYGWIKVAVEALRDRNPRVGQALVLAGEPECGKSLLQNIITHILGGRAAKPYQYMIGKTPFNADLLRAEHLMIEDEPASSRKVDREHLAAQLKMIAANDVHRLHEKNKTPLSVKPLLRVTITLNMQPNHLAVLPAIDDSIAGKIILLKANKQPMPMATATQDDRTKFWQTLIQEIATFLYWILYEYKIPSELVNERYGVKHYHHPEILSAIDGISQETRLLEIIDAELFDGANAPAEWTGTAPQLEAYLTESSAKLAYQARQLFRFNTACGMLLGRLKSRFPDRVMSKLDHNQNVWTIRRPA